MSSSLHSIKPQCQFDRPASNLVEFAKAFTAAAWIKHVGQEMVAKDIVQVNDAPNIDDVWLPFFVEVEPLKHT